MSQSLDQFCCCGQTGWNDTLFIHVYIYTWWMILCRWRLKQQKKSRKKTSVCVCECISVLYSVDSVHLCDDNNLMNSTAEYTNANVALNRKWNAIIPMGLRMRGQITDIWHFLYFINLSRWLAGWCLHTSCFFYCFGNSLRSCTTIYQSSEIDVKTHSHFTILTFQ